MEVAKQNWELENSIQLTDAYRDAIYTYNEEEQKDIGVSKPWKKDPNFFKRVRISAIALLKMVMHARSGGSLEVMGLMQGKIINDTFVVLDAFRLPVEGTETRVNAANEANEYLVQYLQLCRDSGRQENAIGWYHSHPGYGCWLSGIDVSTQDLQQSFQDPFLAIVIDPDRTISAGRVDIGAFRTYPETYNSPTAANGDEYQSIPLHKIEDFGAHANRYYSLEVSYFKSALDNDLLNLLWNKYWVSTISQAPLVMNRAFCNRKITDLSQKISTLAKNSSRTQAFKSHSLGIEKAALDSRKIAHDELSGLQASETKLSIFNTLEGDCEEGEHRERR